METRKTVILDSIDAYNKLYGLTTHHPLVTVINLRDATKTVNHLRMEYGVYALFLKNDINCTLKYGRKTYDYQEGTIVTFSPGQIINVDMVNEQIAPDVIGLMFHPDLIFGTPLGQRIGDYGFFEYSQNEALHLSESERGLFLECLEKIRREIEYPVDKHSADIISVNIHMLLEYLNRFYDRQFITRHKVNNDVVRQFERELKKYFQDDKCREGLPGVAYFAAKANLSPGYFGDLVKKETGTTAQEIISQRIISTAKHKLASTTDDISIIAYDLGFQYPQHFTRFFKKATGQNPTEYRRASAN